MRSLVYGITLSTHLFYVGCIVAPPLQEDPSEGGGTAAVIAGVTAGVTAGVEAGTVVGGGGSDAGFEAGTASGGASVEPVCPTPRVTPLMTIASPLEVVLLDASGSTDGLGQEVASYEWVITDRPERSRAQVFESFTNVMEPRYGGEVDDPSTPEAVLLFDIAGRYELQLIVTDQAGLSAPSEACPAPEATQSFTVLSTDEGGFSVELTWDTPEDSDQLDLEGADLDLYLLHPNATEGWRDGRWTCYYASPNPLWSSAGSGPSMELDDLSGTGPERINYAEPPFTDTEEVPGPYRVGVEYYSAGDLFGPPLGPSLAQLAIYRGPEELFYAERRLERTGQFWDVVELVWTESEKRVTFVDQLFDAIP